MIEISAFQSALRRLKNADELTDRWLS